MGLALMIAGICLMLLAIHPFIFYPLSLKLLAFFYTTPIDCPDVDAITDMRVALCVCAYNEEKVIREKVENMLALRETIPGLEIFVYVDCSEDETTHILASFGELIRVFVSPARLGKTHGMNTLVAMSSADIVVFTDANVEFARDALLKLLAPFADPGIGCTLGHLCYKTNVVTATATTGSYYWRLEEQIKELESITGSAITADGSIYAIRRSLHQAPPIDITDDIYVSLSILCAGYRVVRVRDAIAYEEQVSRPAEEFDRKVRIACQAFNVHCLLWPKLRKLPLLDLYKYISHKLLRWVTIYLQAAGVFLLFMGVFALTNWKAALLLAFVSLFLGRAMWLCNFGPIGQVRAILIAFVATGLGVWRSRQGARFQTWTPPDSARVL